VIALILLIVLLVPITAASYALVAFMRAYARMRHETYLSIQGQRLHNESLRAIELAKAWEKATQPSTTPELPKAPQPIDEVLRGMIEEEITMEDIENSRFDPVVVDKYREQQIRKMRAQRNWP
jgi:hypothetical protein